MKRFLLILLVLLLLISSSTADETFIDLNTFNILFNYAASLTGSGNGIREDNISASLGVVNDIYQVNLAENVGMQISTPHIENYQGELSDINGILLLYVPDGKNNNSVQFIYAIGEIAIATGAISSSSEILNFLNEIGFSEDSSKSEAEGKKMINGLSYSYTISPYIGYLFTVSKP